MLRAEQGRRSVEIERSSFWCCGAQSGAKFADTEQLGMEGHKVAGNPVSYAMYGQDITRSRS